jgi:hypothetical protein
LSVTGSEYLDALVETVSKCLMGSSIRRLSEMLKLPRIQHY